MLYMLLVSVCYNLLLPVVSVNDALTVVLHPNVQCTQELYLV